MNEYFRELRLAAGLSQKDVAEHLGFKSAQIISNIDRGVAVYPKDSISKVAKLFSVSEAEIRMKCYEIKNEKLKRKYGIK